MSNIMDYRECVKLLEELKQQFKEVQMVVTQYANILKQYELSVHKYDAGDVVDDDPNMTPDQVEKALDEIMVKDGE